MVVDQRRSRSISHHNAQQTHLQRYVQGEAPGYRQSTNKAFHGARNSYQQSQASLANKDLDLREERKSRPMGYGGTTLSPSKIS